MPATSSHPLSPLSPHSGLPHTNEYEKHAQSAALGLAIAGALGLGYANIFVTAPSPENLRTLFEFVFKGLDALGYQVPRRRFGGKVGAGGRARAWRRFAAAAGALPSFDTNAHALFVTHSPTSPPSLIHQQHHY